MTDQPYTQDDLRAEAARQHYTATTDPEFMCVGEQMDDETWRSLNEDDHDAAQRAIHSLINGAADVSDWAINLGADGLEPSPNVLNLDGDDQPIVRLHMAFHPDMDERDRQRFGLALARVMANAL
ncbi:hypothetical protein [Streptomyces sp. NPDC019507]|uniref:hypothetical protein n=1 Tax=Streptomyces sp. NPDC019507 TaxID=3154689 RepID=UPI003411D931